MKLIMNITKKLTTVTTAAGPNSLLKKAIFMLGTACVLSCALQACVFVAGAAAGAAAIAVVYDHRTLQKIWQDTNIANEISAKIHKIDDLRNESHIEVTVFNQVVLLTGETPRPEWKQQTENIAQSVSGVSSVYNMITVEGPASSLTQTSDSWITAKVKSQMLADEDLKSGSIKVVTENGTVFLMGTVSQEQADIAVDIAREVSGVQKVVKIFQYKAKPLPNPAR